MFLPTVETTDNALQDNQLPYLRRGQWVKIQSGSRGRFIGYNKRAGTVWMHWYKGDKPATDNNLFALKCSAFDRHQARKAA